MSSPENIVCIIWDKVLMDFNVVNATSINTWYKINKLFFKDNWILETLKIEIMLSFWFSKMSTDALSEWLNKGGTRKKKGKGVSMTCHPALKCENQPSVQINQWVQTFPKYLRKYMPRSCIYVTIEKIFLNIKWICLF